jgi:orotidine-5'-phosphate decarboxylase
VQQTEVNRALRRLPPPQRVITALDLALPQEALALAERLGPSAAWFKVGLQLFTAAGPDMIRQLTGRGCRIFLDLKYHDIPNTVAAAAGAAAALGPSMITVHAAAGRRALAAAAEALAAAPRPAGGLRPALLAVTVLTSLAAEDLTDLLPAPAEPARWVVKLARMACEAGCDGLICAPTDLAALRAEVGPEPLLVCPGIRPTPRRDDQRRTATPTRAAADGADFLVVGRPITGAPDPAAALAQIGRSFTANPPPEEMPGS